ncbi:unnamed protein product [Blepharisma stoltei]|uniref:DOMON domain-containing protein n=1 Tax=Blepharisma stoltei TaxID=1481888 RepID=A0AAU9KBU4_9CILI|nr:unnamed protein product [Blepharisma stoltei]
MIYFLSLICVASSLSIEYLPYGLMLKYFFHDTDTVTMELWIPRKYENIFDWAGIAIQDAADSQETFRCDYYIAVMDGGVFTDRFSTTNGLPLIDEDLGGTNDINSSRRYEQNYLVQSLTRKFNTGDEYDVQLEWKKPYELKWALGPIIDGNIGQHSLRYMGFEYFLMADEYFDKNDDERRRFGPWFEKDLTGIPDFNSEAAKEERTLGSGLKALKYLIDDTEDIQFTLGSSSEFLSRGMSVSWDLSKKRDIILDIFVPKATVEGYQYIIFQFMPSYLPQDEYYRDSYYAELPDGILIDGYSKIDGPKHSNDIDLGGKNDIISSIEITDNVIHYNIKRSRLTGDEYDIDFVYGQAYQVEWTLGKRDENGNDLQIPWHDWGFEYFPLLSYYEDRNRDERAHYGEFYKYAPPEASRSENNRPAEYEWSKILDVRFSERYKKIIEDMLSESNSKNSKIDMISLMF